MIFVTTGTTHMRFDRLFDALETLPAEELVVQHGPVDPPAGVAQAFPFLSFREMVERFETADVVVTHAGAGSIICAMRAGHVPVVVPRLNRFNETVDDHQVELVNALARDGKVVPVWEMSDLADAVRSAPPRRPAALGSQLPIHEALSAVLHGPPGTNGSPPSGPWTERALATALRTLRLLVPAPNVGPEGRSDPLQARTRGARA